MVLESQIQKYLTDLERNLSSYLILEAARCSHLTDAGFTLLARITDSTLIQLSIHCPKLQALSLSHCELITDDGILHLSNSTCGHERLQVLELDNCLLITDVTLEHLENCHNLERIELYDCQQVTRAGIKRIRDENSSGNMGDEVQTSRPALAWVLPFHPCSSKCASPAAELSGIISALLGNQEEPCAS
ncbi:hypothetical protein DUI87_18584 [Hirundo rustica rustica]|uniref:F-box/LRR-repeat protein 15-like leucin rich repeat domain-containing protein n=1 Tax=Hirundo rustica rustica TaxID=333673 RepID=A0A3M0K2E6_HIRRU|nr:hypothetical protein DUI87_18584 [Hirundo rustica rustica]